MERIQLSLTRNTNEIEAREGTLWQISYRTECHHRNLHPNLVNRDWNEQSKSEVAKRCINKFAEGKNKAEERMSQQFSHFQ